MNYTEQCVNSFWNSDPDGDDIQHVLDILNSDFRSFGDALLSIMQAKVGAQIVDPVDHVQKCCKERNVPLAAIASLATLRNWFSGKPRPKKGNDSRRKMFALAFALNLTVEETQELFHKAYLDRSFNQRDYHELIYYFCLNHQMSYTTAEALIEQVRIDDSNSSDVTIFTNQIISDTNKLSEANELLAYICSHSHNFSTQPQSARKIASELKAKAILCAQEYAACLKTLMSNPFLSMDTSSDSFLYATITGQRINGHPGKNGTVTLPITNTELPREIKNNFPPVKSLGDNLDSFEEIRKVIILLFSYEFWYKTEKHQLDIDEKYDQYTAQLDVLLFEANLPPLYYGNPFDWLFMYCTAAQQSLDVFQNVLSEVLDTQCDY